MDNSKTLTEQGFEYCPTVTAMVHPLKRKPDVLNVMAQGFRK